MKDRAVEVDGRKRISLGSLARHDRYLAHVQGDGTIILTPAVVIPVRRMDEIKRELEQGRQALDRLDNEPPF